MISDRGPFPWVGTPCLEFMLEKFLCPEPDVSCLFLVLLEIRKKVGIGHVLGFFQGHRIAFLPHAVDPVQHLRRRLQYQYGAVDEFHILFSLLGKEWSQTKSNRIDSIK